MGILNGYCKFEKRNRRKTSMINFDFSEKYHNSWYFYFLSLIKLWENNSLWGKNHDTRVVLYFIYRIIEL